MSEPNQRSDVGDSICGLIESARNGALDARNQLLNQLRLYVTIVAGKELPDGFQAKFGNSDLEDDELAEAPVP